MKTDYKKFKEASKRVAEVEAEAEESQKPSERIMAQFERVYETSWGKALKVRSTTVMVRAILDYLDEQYEKENH